MVYHYKAELGKLFTGICIVDTQGQRLSIKRIVFRNFIGYTFSTIMFGLGYWSIIKDKEKRAWHDKISGSYVVTVNPHMWIFGLLLFLSIVGVEAYFFTTAFTTFMKSGAVKEINYLTTQIQQIEKERKQQEELAQFYPETTLTPAFKNRLEKMQSLNREEKYTQAEIELKKLPSIAKTNGEKAIIANLMGLYAEQNKKYKEAEKQYFQATVLYPKYSTAYANLSMLQRYYLYKNEEAVKNAEKSVSLTPNDAYAHFALGLALYDSGKEKEGIEHIKKAIQINPEVPSYKKVLDDIEKTNQTQKTQSVPSINTGYILIPSPQQYITNELHFGGGYAVTAVLQDKNGIVINEDGLTYDWISNNTSVATVTPQDFCGHSLPPPCRNRAVISPLSVGSATITVKVFRGNDYLAQASYFVTNKP